MRSICGDERVEFEVWDCVAQPIALKESDVRVPLECGNLWAWVRMFAHVAAWSSKACFRARLRNVTTSGLEARVVCRGIGGRCGRFRVRGESCPRDRRRIFRRAKCEPEAECAAAGAVAVEAFFHLVCDLVGLHDFGREGGVFAAD